MCAVTVFSRAVFQVTVSSCVVGKYVFNINPIFRHYFVFLGFLNHPRPYFGLLHVGRSYGFASV